MICNLFIIRTHLINSLRVLFIYSCINNEVSRLIRPLNQNVIRTLACYLPKSRPESILFNKDLLWSIGMSSSVPFRHTQSRNSTPSCTSCPSTYITCLLPGKPFGDHQRTECLLVSCPVCWLALNFPLYC